MVDLISGYPTETGVQLDRQWEGARRVHCANDAYRIIWEVDDEREAVVVLLIGKKSQRAGRTIYDLPRPPWPPERR
jgi:mRNA-degrading endonuclease RelE of RelBE toxin-antitoxin system